jgi:hypothetical protein
MKMTDIAAWNLKKYILHTEYERQQGGFCNKAPFELFSHVALLRAPRTNFC